MLDELRDHVAQEDRRDRETGEHRVHAGAAEDPLRQDHAAVAARHCRAAGRSATRPRWRTRRSSMRSSGGRGPRRRSSEQAGLPAAAHHGGPGGAHAGAVLEAALLAYALPPDPPQPEHRGRYPDCDGKDDELIRHRPSLRQSRGTRWATAEAGVTEVGEREPGRPPAAARAARLCCEARSGRPRRRTGSCAPRRRRHRPRLIRR